MIKNLIVKFALLVSLLHTILICQGQTQLIPLNYQYNLSLEELIQNNDTGISTGFKPLIKSQILNIIKEFNVDSSKYYYGITQKIFKEHLLSISEKDFLITIDPVFNFSYGRDFNDTVQRDIFRNTRGFLVQGEIGSKFSFNSSFYENQSIEPWYVHNYIIKNGVAPGQGRVKGYKGDKGFDYAMASGNFSYSPKEFINIQFGHGKNFVGHGYRSMLWSDNSFNYPFFKTTAKVFKNKLSYTSLLGVFQNLVRLSHTSSTEAVFQRKGGTIHYLDFLPHKKIEIGIFESIIYDKQDTSKVLSIPYNYFIPIIGANTALITSQEKYNIAQGVNIKFKVNKDLFLYGQFIAERGKINQDQIGDNYGYQLGFKLFSPFSIENAYLLAEFNTSEASRDRLAHPFLSRLHYNQPAAHPLSKNFQEILGILNYRFKKFYVQFKGIGQTKEVYFKPKEDRSNSDKFFEKVDVVIIDSNLGINLNRKTNAQLFVGMTYRDEFWKNYKLNNSTTTYFYISLKTSLTNLYYDY